MAPPKFFWFTCIFLIYISISSASVVRRHADLHCPQSCHCITNHTTHITTYHCSSLDFVQKLTPKENAAITSLDISNISLHTLDKRLKKLVNLERLNLAYNKLTDLRHFAHIGKLTHLNVKANHIKSFSVKDLPTTLKSLDISHNNIRELPFGLTRLHALKHIAIFESSFSCTRESLETRDTLLDYNVKIVGHATCDEPEKLKGQSWFHAVDFDEFFKLQDQEGMLADEPEEGSGFGDELGSGLPIVDGTAETTTKLEEVTEEVIQVKHVNQDESGIFHSGSEPETTTSDFAFDGASGDGPVEVFNKEIDKQNSAPGQVVVENDMQAEEKGANMGTNIFLGIFLLCLVSLMIYAIRKNKERKREARRKKREENLRNKTIEMMPKVRKASDRKNGNSDAMPLMNGQNGNSKPEDEPAEEINQPLLENEPVNNEVGDYQPSAPLLNSDVKTVKVKAAEIPDSVPQTPILVSRSRTSDGNLVVTPKTSPRNS